MSAIKTTVRPLTNVGIQYKISNTLDPWQLIVNDQQKNVFLCVTNHHIQQMSLVCCRNKTRLDLNTLGDDSWGDHSSDHFQQNKRSNYHSANNKE